MRQKILCFFGYHPDGKHPLVEYKETMVGYRYFHIYKCYLCNRKFKIGGFRNVF